MKEDESFAKYLARFEQARHPHTRRAREMKDAVARAEGDLYGANPERLVQGHGDYHPKNIYIGQDNPDKRDTQYVAAIDFNNSCALPPAYDVGTFLAQFRNQFAEYPDVLHAIPEEVFLEEYLSGAKERGADFMDEVELFRARADLNIASFLIKVGLGQSEKLWRVLVEGERALAVFEFSRQAK